MNEESLFHRALELCPAERSAFLDAACAGNTGLRQRLEVLLQAHAQPGSFLQERAVTLPAEAPSAPQVPEAAGMRIGPYKLIEPIGEGGMGSVWMAEQLEPVRRLVALKLIKEGLDSARVIARFEAERQALALMDHPNIAKVFDAGTTASGRPYFVMELVKGVAITRYCDEQRLTPRQRLELFIPVCQAVQHAHQKGVIHRDLKPSNVLVTLYDGQPVPKVIDFGIAKATGDPLTERTLNTGFGAIVGTLEYMSPEQAEPNQLDIDTRSDVYSLGVLLYELLTGSTPLDRKRLQDAAIWELLRVIREEEPQRPSTRLSSSDGLPALSAQRQMEPVKLARLMRGELDWIVMKALEKDRQRRYDTANALADDLNRYLRDEPVQAGPPSPTYRLRKFVQRNRGSVLAASLLLLTLLTGTVGTTWGWLEAQEQRDVAELARNDEAKQHAAAVKAEQAEKRRAGELAIALDRTAAAERAERQRAGELQDALTESQLNFANNQIFLAQSTWNGPNGAVQANAYLDAIPERFRNWEWRYLKRQYEGGLFSLYGHDSSVTRVAYSSDGSRLVSGSSDSTLRIWDARTGALLHILTGHTRPVTSLACSSDGQYIASGSEDATIRIWDARTGRALHELKGHTNQIITVKWSYDSRRLLSTEVDCTMRVWDAHAGKQLHVLKGDPATMVTVAWSPDGTRIVSSGPSTGAGANETRVWIWDAHTGKPLQQLKGRHLWVNCVAWSRDGQRLVSGGFNDRTVRIWDGTTGQTLHELKGHRAAVSDVAWSDDGQRVASAAADGIRLWDAHTGELRHELKGHAGGAGRVLWNNDGTRLASRGNDLTARIWDARTGELLHTLRGHPGEPWWITSGVTDMAWRGDGQFLATAGGLSVRIWDARPGAAQHEIKGIPPPGRLAPTWGNYALNATGDRIVNQLDGATVWALNPQKRPVYLATKDTKPGMPSFMVWSRDGARIASSGRDSSVRILDAHTSKLLRELKVYTKPGMPTPIMVWSDDGQRLATMTYPDAGMRIWDTHTGQLLHILEHNFLIKSAAFSRDGRLLASSDGTLRIWDTRTGQVLHHVKNAGIADCMAFNSDGSRLACGSRLAYEGHPETIQVWNTQTGQRLYTTTANVTAVRSIAWSADDSRLVSGSRKLVRLWDARTGMSLLDLHGHENQVGSVAFSTDGTQIISEDEDGVVRIWDARPGALRQWLRTHELYQSSEIAWSRDSSRFAVNGPKARVLDAHTGKLLHELKGNEQRVACVAWSQDGKRIVSGSLDGRVRIHDADTGQLLQELPGHKGAVSSVAWSQDGKRIVSGSLDGRVQIHDADTGQLLQELPGHKGFISNVAWSPDDLRLASGGPDKVVRIWDVKSGRLVQELRGHVTHLYRVAWSRDARYVVSTDRSTMVIVWEAATGARLPGGPLPPLLEVGSASPDGRRAVITVEHEALLVDLEGDEVERQRRLWLTRPDPEWHVQQRLQFREEKNAYAAALHESWEQHARGVLAFERGEFSQALAHFIAAAALKPSPTPERKLP